MIGIVDYNAGNIKSVERSLLALGIDYKISKNPKDLENVDRVIFPGVGEAAFAMDQLQKSGFDSFLKDFAASGKPLLGICLGSQVIFDYSEEGDTQCLGLVKGSVKHFASVLPESEKDLKIPHMGWSSVDFVKNLPIFDGIPNHSDFYFVCLYFRIICCTIKLYVYITSSKRPLTLIKLLSSFFEIKFFTNSSIP